MGPRNHGREIAFLVSGALRPINGWNTVIGGSVRSADDRHFQWALADGSGFEERNVLAHVPPRRNLVIPYQRDPCALLGVVSVERSVRCQIHESWIEPR